VIEHKGWGQPEPAHSGWASGGGDEGGYGGGGWERRSDVGIAEASAPVPVVVKPLEEKKA